MEICLHKNMRNNKTFPGFQQRKYKNWIHELGGGGSDL